jgi:hypothetical protein
MADRGAAAGPDADPRHVFIREVQQGRSFIDIGGLHEARFERVSVAAAAGATKLALMDVEGPDCPWWAQVRERLESKGISNCEFISGDVLSYDLPSVDIVHSSGVLYHLPSPIDYIARLRKVTNHYCILTSSTIPTRIAVDHERIYLPEGAVVFIPGLRGKDKAIFREWFRRRGRPDVTYAEDTMGGHRNLRNYYPNWFMPTVSAFRAMAISGGFEIVKEAEVEPESLSYCLLLKPV